MDKVFFLSLGGVFGTLARYYMGNLTHRFFGSNFPFGTLSVNLIGCFLIGLFGALAEKKLFFGPEMRLLLMVGFCGAFTTFSSYIFETHGLMQNGEMIKALGNVVLNIVLGFAIFKLGLILGEMI